MIRRRLRITGRVQGVFYRAWLQAHARTLGLAGWVRNRRDGSVEAVAEGAADQIEALARLARDGPPAARVAEVLISDDAPAEALAGFARRTTA